VVVAYALFVLIGLASGVNGPLLLAQMSYYGIGRAAIGLTFVSFATGFVLAGATAGPLLHRWGTRTALLGGGLAFLAGGLTTASRPPFVLFVLVGVVTGYGIGMTETVLNAFLAARDAATTLLNLLHAFFGVGALLGPVAAVAMLRAVDWNVVVLVLALVGVPALVAVRATFPDRDADALHPASRSSDSTSDSSGAATDRDPAAATGVRSLASVLRSRAVLLGAAMLSIYVGLEIGVGNWAYGFLVEARSSTDLLAGWTVSAYWFGLTLARFVVSPVATRNGLTKVSIGYLSLGGVVAAITLTWLVPVATVAVIGLALLGFFLGPIFPTTMAAAPDLVPARSAPTAIGVMNAGSILGGAALPWLAGAIGQSTGIWTLLPFALVLALAQLVVWWRMAAHMGRPSAVLGAAPSQAHP
jgi:fucose permease